MDFDGISLILMDFDQMLMDCDQNFMDFNQSFIDLYRMLSDVDQTLIKNSKFTKITKSKIAEWRS